MDAETYGDVRRALLLIGAAIEAHTETSVEAVQAWEGVRRALKAVEAGHVAIDTEIDGELEDLLDD